jgi:hypothetical protein
MSVIEILRQLTNPLDFQVAGKDKTNPLWCSQKGASRRHSRPATLNQPCYVLFRFVLFSFAARSGNHLHFQPCQVHSSCRHVESTAAFASLSTASVNS